MLVELLVARTYVVTWTMVTLYHVAVVAAAVAVAMVEVEGMDMEVAAALVTGLCILCGFCPVCDLRSVLLDRVRTILVLGYWVLGNIHRYWVVSLLGDIFCCSDTQFNTNQTAVSTVHMPVHVYLVLLVTCTLIAAIVYLDTMLICCCLLNTIIVIII